MARIILYTGKGGVGKTTVAAATALRCAEQGKRTIVFSTDTAHSLADSFDQHIGPEPTQLAPNLWAQEPDMYYNLEKYWGTVRDWLAALMSWRGIDDVVAEEIAVIPGMEELVNLLWINRHYDEGRFDVIVVDCAPTGETLQLLSFPETARWWMEKLFPIQRRAARIVQPIIQRLMDIPLPDEKVYDTAEELFQQLFQMYHLLCDGQKSSVRLVVNAEKMVIKEAQRAFTYFNLYGYTTDVVVCNRLLPDHLTDSYFAAWKESQAGYFKMVEEAFSPIPILSAPLLQREVVGLDMLREMGKAVFGQGDASQLYFQGKAQSVHRENGRYVLSLRLPFSEKGDISLLQVGEELVVRVGRHKRTLILPHALLGLEQKGAEMQGDLLNIYFVDKSDGGKTGHSRQKTRS
ncbi:MAG: ArsA family ATPase [Dehalococcoidia bacterium]|nr:ArsA family ATPase [Dehalococcoidia bacterium]